MGVRTSVKTFDWHKLMFVLPNLFTVSSIFCGFYSMILSTQGRWIGASLSIFFANFFDTFDGRVARMTKTQSEFGTEMDSLADVISFGVAPAFLVYQWSLKDMGMGGAVIAFIFAMCGALRLARFNVLAHRHVPGSSDFFVGVPIPLGAGTIFSLVLAQEAAGGIQLMRRPGAVAVVVILTALLMVSSIRYRTFKNTKFTRKAVAILGAILLLGVVLSVAVLHPAVVLLFYFLAYLAMGIVEGIIGLIRHKPVGQQPSPAAADGSSAPAPEASSAEGSEPEEEPEEELAEEDNDSGMAEGEEPEGEKEGSETSGEKA